MTGFRRAALASCLVVLLAVPCLLRAQTNDRTSTLQVRPADREVISRQPRQVVALAFMVRNTTGRRIEAEPHLILPAGWRLVTPELPFALADAATSLRLVSFMIPETARSGDYPVTYEVLDRQLPAVRDAYTVRVNVLPEQKLQVLALESSGFAIAGESYHRAFLVRNTGNAAITAEFRVRSASGSEPEPRAGTVQIAPGESSNIEIDVVTADVHSRMDELLTLTVEVPGTSIRDSAISTTQIVPRVSAGQAYHTLSTELGLSFITREVRGKQVSGWQAGLAGSGTLDEANTRHLGIRLRGPDIRNQGSFGYGDDYSLSYWDSTTTATAGDGIYGLSLLTEPGRYGRGAGFGYQYDGLGVSGYQAKDRFGTDREQLGFTAHSQVTPGTRLDFNWLDKRGGTLPATLHSMSTQTQWADGLHTQIEIGQSDSADESGQAFRGSLYDSSHAVSYYLLGWRAGAEYRGYLRDEEYLSTGFDYPRGNQGGLHGYYRFQKRNLDADATRPAPREQQANFGMERTLPAATRATLDFNVRTYVDRHGIPHSTPGIDIQNRSARLGFSRSFGDISVMYAVERGRAESRITDTNFDTALHVFSAYWQASPAQNYGIYALRDDNAFAKEQRGAQTTFGLHASYDLAATTLSVDAQRNYDAPDNEAIQDSYATPGYYDRFTKRHSTYNMLVLHKRANGDRISLLARHIDGRLPQTDVLLSYSVPFDLPLFRKANVATVRGLIYDAESGAGMRNVVLNLDGLTAVTDAAGKFEFPAITAGGYQLSMDRSNIDVGKVPLGSLPLSVSVASHDTKQIDIALVRSITLSVSVKLHTKASPAVVHGMEHVLVTLKSGEHVYHRLTDADGHIRLAGLPPGEWLASIAADAIPQGYGTPSRELTLQVPPGASASAEFPLTQITRELKMLPPLEVN